MRFALRWLITHRRWPLVILLWMVGAALAVGLAYVLVDLLPRELARTDEAAYPVQRLAEEGRLRTALLSLLAGIVAIAGAIYTARTFALSRRGQVTDRITRAVDQLGHESVVVRLGGIYALGRVARESFDDQDAILEVLTAHVRQHSPWPADDERAVPSRALQRLKKALRLRAAAPQEPPPANADARAVIAVLQRQKRRRDEHCGTVIDLGSTNLCGVQTQRLRLAGAHLSFAQLRRATLIRARLRHANLIGAQLEGAVLTGADLRDASLQSTVMRGAHLQGANLTGARLEYADLKGAQYTAKTKWNGARYNSKTIWPAGLDQDGAGAIRVGSAPAAGP